MYTCRFIGSRAILSGPAGGVVSGLLCLQHSSTACTKHTYHTVNYYKLSPLSAAIFYVAKCLCYNLCVY